MFLLEAVEECEAFVDLLLPFGAVGDAVGGMLQLTADVVEFDERRVEACEEHFGVGVVGGYV